jgi:hypothetical protein
MKTVALRTNVPAVKSPSAKMPPKVPATKLRDYQDFDDLVELADRLLNRFDDLVVRKLLDDGTTMPALEHFAAELDFFESDDLYRPMDRRRRSLLPHHVTDQQIRVEFVSFVIGELLGSFPNANPHAPEQYARALIEEVMAARPSVLALESACREIRRTKTFLPSVAELLTVLREREEWWLHRREMIANLREHLEELPLGNSNQLEHAESP